VCSTATLNIYIVDESVCLFLDGGRKIFLGDSVNGRISVKKAAILKLKEDKYGIGYE
jgi:hypothetical protein